MPDASVLLDHAAIEGSAQGTPPRRSPSVKGTAATLLWIVDIYGFLLAGSLITMGALGDRIGRRRLLLIGATAFVLASVLAAFRRVPRC
jgi:MFS transporter, DHA2 family, multidrug resistance protein